MTKRKKLTGDTSGHILLIDGDIIIFRIACTTEDETEDVAKIRLNQYIDDLFHESFCSDYRVFLSDNREGNFRYKVYPEYKAGRAPRPKHYDMLRDYLLKYEKAEVAWGQEADDLLGIEQCEHTMICTLDKDLQMIPGMHFHMKHRTHKEISHAEARHSFYRQLLTGDSVDNIPGIRGIGPKKADKILTGCTDDASYKAAVINAYTELTKIDNVNEHLNLIGKLLWIRRKPDEMWEL